jgi:hypothetical protein
MSRGPLVLVGVIALALGAAALSQWVSGRAVPEHPLELAPVGTTAVVRVDVPALLDSPLWAAWVGEGDEGYHRIVDRCGFDPLLDLRTVDVYLVGTSRRPLDQVGFVARGPLRHEELARCVELISEEDGGGVHEVEIEGVRAVASNHGSSRAAFVGNEAVFGGDESLVRDLLRRAHGEGPSLAEDETLASLYRRAQVRGDIVAVARVPESWRPVIARATAGDASWEPAASTVAVGLGARVRHGLGATLVLELGDPEDARDLRGALLETIDGVLSRPLVRLSTLGGALRHVDADTDGQSLVVTVDLDEEELGAVVAYAREAVAAALSPATPLLPGDPSPPSEGAPSEAALPVPDEVIRVPE